MSPTELPDWVTFPGENWFRISPEQAGLDPERMAAFVQSLDVRGASFGGEDHTGNKFGAMITRGGYLVHSWGDIDYRFQTASTGKALMWAILGFAVEDGLLDPNEPINKTWTGEGQLSHPHKYLDQGHHKTLTWRHLIGPKTVNLHYGGFPIEFGVRWSERRSGLEEKEAQPGVAEWATWTGDPFYDLYSHVEPGTEGLYSSGGFWRLGQALTAAYGTDLKDVIDQRLFGKIGIAPDSWDWMTGRSVAENKYLYPDIPDSYTYLDPPFEIDGNVVRSGPGWIVISAADMARFGHLQATGGMWDGRRVIDPLWLRGHGGGNKSGVSGEGQHFTAMGVVAAEGLVHAHSTAADSFLPQDVFAGPVDLARA